MPPTPPPMKPGTPKLSDVARLVVAPSGITATGWPAVEQCCRVKLGVEFDPWQHGAGRLILAKRADGHLASMIDGVGMSLPRQVGKTYLIGAMVFALCVLNPGLLVIWSAHHARTHGETFLSMQGFARRSRVKAFVAQVFKGSGDEEIRFHNGSRILFGARERGFGRGIPAVDVLVFDEAQILSDRALANMLATMNVSRFGLALFIGTPPRPEDNSEAFERMRQDAREGRLTDGAWIEFGAEPGSTAHDRAAWARANPSFPKRTPVQSMLRLQRKLTAEDWLREGLGIWDSLGSLGVFPRGSWQRRAVKPGGAPAPAALGVAADPDGVWLSLGAASAGDRAHLGSVLRVRQDGGRAAFVAEVARIQSEQGCPVGIDTKGPASGLIPELTEAGVVLAQGGLEDFIQACSDIVQAVTDGTVEHANYSELDDAVAAAGWRKVGDRRVFARRTGEIDALEAVTWALWAAGNADTDVWGFWE